MFDKPIENISYKDICDLVYRKKEREGQILDYKREFHKEGKEFAKDLTAFANASGGYIIYGIDESSNDILGISDTVNGKTKIDDWIANVLNDMLDETAEYNLAFIEVSEEETEKFVVILQILESEKKPIFVKENNKQICYIRKGSSVFSAKSSDIKAMYESKVEIQPASESNNIKQNSKGNHNVQVGINQGTIIKTDKVVKKNEIKPNIENHISEAQAKEIKECIDKIVEINEQAGKGNKSKIYPETWQSFYNRFKITSYKLLPKETFEDAITWLKQQIAFEHRPKLRKSNNDQWKKDIYGAIYAKSQKSLGLDKQGLYDFALEKLKLKTPINSLKDLSDTRLNKLYKLIFSE